MSADSRNVIARFVPQAWVNDYAIDVDPQGDTTWTATAAFNELPEDYRASLIAQMAEGGEALDGDDMLQSDPAAPEWVRGWHGPFSLYIHYDDVIDPRLWEREALNQDVLTLVSRFLWCIENSPLIHIAPLPDSVRSDLGRAVSLLEMVEAELTEQDDG